MSIGERIVALRTERKMSQSDLAEALNVSRQSISKWETDSSVPELEKLVALCEIFGVSMDARVRGIEAESVTSHKNEEPAWTAPEAYTQEVVHVVRMETRKIAGVLLFVCAMLCIGTCTFLGDMIARLLLALPFIECGVSCLACKKRAGLCADTSHGQRPKKQKGAVAFRDNRIKNEWRLKGASTFALRSFN